MLAAPPGFRNEIPSAVSYTGHIAKYGLALNRYDTLSLRAYSGRLDALQALGPDDVWRLDCNEQPVTDAALECVSHLNIEVLLLARTRVTDAGMHTLARMPKLRHLNLDDCDITDIGLRTIAASETLVELELYGTHVTGTGLTALTRHPSLQIVDLRHTGVHDGLEPLVTMPKLKEVRLSWWATRHVDVLRQQRPEVVLL